MIQKRTPTDWSGLCVRVTYFLRGAIRALPVAEQASRASGSGQQMTKALRRRGICWVPQQAARQVSSAHVSLTSVFGMGSDGSAAGGGLSDLSEWLRSKKSRISVSPQIFSGTATGNRWTGPPKILCIRKTPTYWSGLCVRVTYFPRQSPAKYRQRM